MLDLNFIRQNPEVVRKAISGKGVVLDLNQILEIDKTVKNLKRQTEQLRQERNTISKATSSISQDERTNLIDRGRQVNVQLKRSEASLAESEAKLLSYLLLIPNIPAADEPIGTGEHNDVEYKRWGEPPAFNFPALEQIEILNKHGWAEFNQASKTSGSRSYILKGEMVKMEMALWQLGIDHMIERGFTPISVPLLLYPHNLKACYNTH